MDLGMEPESPALQTDSLLLTPQGSPEILGDEVKIREGSGKRNY